jgi:hypothetical protein
MIIGNFVDTGIFSFAWRFNITRMIIGGAG